jgi:SNF2 family DNA or RNA helicase
MKVFIAPFLKSYLTQCTQTLSVVAHRIRNRTSKTFEVVCAVQATAHWCLTGTPIQNFLDDYGALLAFIGVPPFLTKSAFNNWIDKPFKSKDPNSLPTLRKLVAATCLRRTKAHYASTLDLTQKTELLEPVEMTPHERQLYEFFKRRTYLIAGFEVTANKLEGQEKRKTSLKYTNMLVVIGLLRLICNHGEALLSESALKAWKNREASSITWEMLESSVRRCDSCGREIEDMDNIESIQGELACGHVVCDACASKTQSPSSSSYCLKCGKLRSAGTSPSPSHAKYEFNSKERYLPSSKVKALLRNLAKLHSAPKFESEPSPQKR